MNIYILLLLSMLMYDLCKFLSQLKVHVTIFAHHILDFDHCNCIFCTKLSFLSCPPPHAQSIIRVSHTLNKIWKNPHPPRFELWYLGRKHLSLTIICYIGLCYPKKPYLYYSIKNLTLAPPVIAWLRPALSLTVRSCPHRAPASPCSHLLIPLRVPPLLPHVLVPRGLSVATAAPMMLDLPSPLRAATAPHLLGSPLAPPPPHPAPPTPLAPTTPASIQSLLRRHRRPPCRACLYDAFLSISTRPEG